MKVNPSRELVDWAIMKFSGYFSNPLFESKISFGMKKGFLGCKITENSHQYLITIRNNSGKLQVGELETDIPDGISFPNGLFVEIEVKEFRKDASGDLLAEFPLVENVSSANFYHLNGPKLKQEDNLLNNQKSPEFVLLLSFNLNH